MIFTESDRKNLLISLRDTLQGNQDENQHFGLIECMTVVENNHDINDIIAFLDAAMNTLDFILHNLSKSNADLPMMQDTGVRYGYIAAFRGYMERYRNAK